MIYPPDSGILSSLCLRVETADNSWNCSSFCSRKSICKRVGLECLIGAPVDNHDVFFFHCVLSYGLWCFANGTGICIIGWGCVSLFGVTQPTQWIQTMSQCITGYEVPFSSFLGFYHGFTMVLPWNINASTTFRVLAILLRDACLEAVSEHLLGAGKVVTKLGQLAQFVAAKENPPVSESQSKSPQRNRWGWLTMVNGG